jgi:hypothetical protein
MGIWNLTEGYSGKRSFTRKTWSSKLSFWDTGLREISFWDQIVRAVSVVEHGVREAPLWDSVVRAVSVWRYGVSDMPLWDIVVSEASLWDQGARDVSLWNRSVPTEISLKLNFCSEYISIRTLYLRWRQTTDNGVRVT